MPKVNPNHKKYAHKNCGGEIEIYRVRESFRDLYRCKKCGDSWKDSSPLTIE